MPDQIRQADKPRGPEKYPHWHDSPEWAKHTTMTRGRFLKMTGEQFADWVTANREDAKAFFYALKWPEATYYWSSQPWLRACFPGLLHHRQNWPTVLLDVEEATCDNGEIPWLTLHDMSHQFAARIDHVDLAEQIRTEYQNPSPAKFGDFTDLRVMLVPMVTAYQQKRYQPDGEAFRGVVTFMLDEHGKLIADSIHRSVDEILEEPLVFGTCDDCGDPWYHDHLTDVANEKLCPKCKQEHEDAAVHSDSSAT